LRSHAKLGVAVSPTRLRVPLNDVLQKADKNRLS